MTWAQLPSEVQAAALEALSPKQLDVFKLHLAGLGARRISDMLSISRSTARTHLADAHRKLEQAGVSVDAAGRYYRNEVAA